MGESRERAAWFVAVIELATSWARPSTCGGSRAKEFDPAVAVGPTRLRLAHVEDQDHSGFRRSEDAHQAFDVLRWREAHM